MRILLINVVCGVTSTGKICTDLAQVYEKIGHEVRIAYGRNDKGKAEQFEKYGVRIGNDLDVKIHGVITRLFDKHGFASKRATRVFLKWVDEYKPDIIHLHNLHGYYINIELLFNYIKRKNIPVVWTLHDCWGMTGHCAHFNAFGCTKWKNVCRDCELKHTYPISIGLDNSLRNFLKKKELFTRVKNMIVVTPSCWLKSIVEQSFLKEYEVRVINNGIDTSVFIPTESNLRAQYDLQNKKIILGVANVWEENKGLECLIKMSEDLSDSWKVVVIGLSNEQINNIPSNMLGLKRTANVRELASWYTVADVFVNPTLEDTYPTTNLEAQACGTPVVTYDSDGASETILPNKGIVVEKMNYEKLLMATVEAAKMKQGFGVAQIKDKIELGKEYENLYQDLLKIMESKRDENCV